MTPTEVIMGINVFLPEGFPPYTPYKGSIQVEADCCGRFVWLGPACQLKKAEEPETKIVCAICAIQAGVTPETHEIRPLTKKGMGQ